MLVIFIMCTISFTQADVRDYEQACTQLAFDLISKKVDHIQENNMRIHHLNRLDESFAELSHKKPEKREKMDFIKESPVFNHETDIMTVNYMARIMKLIQAEKAMDKKVQMKSIAMTNLATEYKKRIPKFMNDCVNLVVKNNRKCINAKDEKEKLTYCYDSRLLANEKVRELSPFFKDMEKKGIIL